VIWAASCLPACSATLHSDHPNGLLSFWMFCAELRLGLGRPCPRSEVIFLLPSCYTISYTQVARNSAYRMPPLLTRALPRGYGATNLEICPEFPWRPPGCLMDRGLSTHHTIHEPQSGTDSFGINPLLSDVGRLKPRVALAPVKHPPAPTPSCF